MLACTVPGQHSRFSKPVNHSILRQAYPADLRGLLAEQLGQPAHLFITNPEKAGFEAERLVSQLFKSVPGWELKVWETPVGSSADKHSVDLFVYEQSFGVLFVVSVKAICCDRPKYSDRLPSVDRTTLRRLGALAITVVRLIVVINCEDYDISVQQWTKLRKEFVQYMLEEACDGGEVTFTIPV